MNEPIVYVIKGDPISWKRAVPGKHGVWDAQKEEKLITGLTIKQQHNDRPFYVGPLRMVITFFMRMSATMKANHYRKPVPLYHTKAPDNSNLTKFYEDVCTGLIYSDDKLICDTQAVKIYDWEPRVEFSIKELGNEVLPPRMSR